MRRARPMNPVVERHVHIRGTIKGWWLSKGKILAPGALCDLVRVGHEAGPYAPGMGTSMIEYVQRWFGRYKPEHQFLLPLMTAVLEGGPNVEDGVIQALSNAGYEIPPRYNYPHLEEFKIHITDNLDEGLSFFSKYKEPRECPLYVDTEHAYWTLPNGRDVALVTICDVKEKTILLLRTHQFTHREFSDLEFALSDLASITKIATFGKENILKLAEKKVINLQLDKEVSLKTYAEGFGMTLKKSETMSDWCRDILRHDQVQYAAMDAMVLWKLHEDIVNHPEK